MDKKRILILPGDGIGPESIDEVKKIIDFFILFNIKFFYLFSCNLLCTYYENRFFFFLYD